MSAQCGSRDLDVPLEWRVDFHPSSVLTHDMVHPQTTSYWYATYLQQWAQLMEFYVWFWHFPGWQNLGPWKNIWQTAVAKGIQEGSSCLVWLYTCVSVTGTNGRANLIQTAYIQMYCEENLGEPAVLAPLFNTTRRPGVCYCWGGLQYQQQLPECFQMLWK